MTAHKTTYTLEIEGLTHDGRGVGHHNGKAVFIEDTVPGDTIEAITTKSHTNFDEARCVKLVTPSAERTEPFCPVYEQCGGCQLQHLSLSAQRHWKTQNFLTQLTQAVDATQCQVMEPLTGDDKHYRRRARLRYTIDKKDKTKRVGFKKQNSNEVVDIEQCPILSDALNKALQANKTQLQAQASRAEKEVFLVEADNGVFGSDSLEIETNSEQTPYYQLRNTNGQNVSLHFPIDGFIQVNGELNQQMVSQALNWLNLEANHKVLDLFCGVGNFTLPIAQQVEKTVGIEGEQALVDTATDNAKDNQFENVTFYKNNLFEDISKQPWFKKQKYDRILLDPGRLGAFELCKQLGDLKAKLIVYVSCNAATLIRDVKELEKQGYRLTKAGFIDMFPHTTHGEVMVQLTRTHKPFKGKTKRPVFKI